VKRQNTKIAELKTEERAPVGSSFFIKPVRSKLQLNDGLSFDGQLLFPVKSKGVGEVVFNTGMTGYVES
jgi:hypothetical protein